MNNGTLKQECGITPVYIAKQISINFVYGDILNKFTGCIINYNPNNVKYFS